MMLSKTPCCYYIQLCDTLTKSLPYRGIGTGGAGGVLASPLLGLATIEKSLKVPIVTD